MGAGPLAAVSLASSVFGTVQKAAGERNVAAAQEQNARFREAVARNNAIRANQAAEDARNRGEASARLQQQRTRQLIGKQRAIFAANGIVVDQDSALDTTEDTAQIGAMDAEQIRRNAERDALNFETQGENFVSEANLSSFEARSSRRAGRTDSFNTVLGGIGSVASKWKAFSDEGIFG